MDGSLFTFTWSAEDMKVVSQQGLSEGRQDEL